MRIRGLTQKSKRRSSFFDTEPAPTNFGHSGARASKIYLLVPAVRRGYRRRDDSEFKMQVQMRKGATAIEHSKRGGALFIVPASCPRVSVRSSCCGFSLAPCALVGGTWSAALPTLPWISVVEKRRTPSAMDCSDRQLRCVLEKKRLICIPTHDGAAAAAQRAHGRAVTASRLVVTEVPSQLRFQSFLSCCAVKFSKTCSWCSKFKSILLEQQAAVG